MAAPSVVGSGNFVEQPQEKRKVQGAGWIVTRIWHGTAAGLDDFVTGTVIPLRPESIDVAYTHPAVVRASFPDGTEGTDPLSSDPLSEAEDEATWELVPMTLDKPLATHPAFGEYNGAAGVKVIELIEKAIREGTATETDWDAAWGTQNMNDYRNLRAKGTDSWRTWTWMIRKTIRVGRWVDISAEEAKTQRIVDYNEIGIPADVKWAQPKYVPWNGQAAENPQPIKEWMASPPTIRWTGKKYEISREWLGAVKWYAVLYQGGSAASTAAGL